MAAPVPTASARGYSDIHLGEDGVQGWNPWLGRSPSVRSPGSNLAEDRYKTRSEKVLSVGMMMEDFGDRHILIWWKWRSPTTMKQQER